MQHQLAHLRHRIGRVGERVELLEKRFQLHALIPPAATRRPIPAKGNALGIKATNEPSPERAIQHAECKPLSANPLR